MNLELLIPLEGCRLESIRVSKGSFTLELEKSGNGNRSLYEMSTNGYVIDDSEGQLDVDHGARLLARCLEYNVVQINVDSAEEAIEITFSNRNQITFSTKGTGADSIAMVQDKLEDVWFLVD